MAVRLLLAALLAACSPASVGPPTPDLSAPAADLPPARDLTLAACTSGADCPKGVTDEGASYDFICCDAFCRDPHNDPMYCGACFARCKEGERCRKLSCLL